MKAPLIINLLLLAACEGGNADRRASGSNDLRQECAVSGADWRSECSMERDGDVLIVRHTDGGFRRFRLLSDGRGLEVLDGAEAASVKIIGADRIEVEVGGDRYRLPARMPDGTY